MVELVSLALISISLAGVLFAIPYGSVVSCFIFFIALLVAVISNGYNFLAMELVLSALLLISVILSGLKVLTIGLYQLITEIPSRLKAKILIGTTLRWLLFPLVAIVGYILMDYVTSSSSKFFANLIYQSSIEANEGYSCGENKKLVCTCNSDSAASLFSDIPESHGNLPKDRSLECPDRSFAKIYKGTASSIQVNIHYAVDRIYNKFRMDIADQVKTRTAHLILGQKSVSQSVMHQLFYANETDVIVPRYLATISPGLEPPDCEGIDDWIRKTGDCVTRRVLKPLNKAYEHDLRPTLVSKVSQELKRSGSTIEKGAASVEKETQKFIENQIEQYRIQTHNEIKLIFFRAKQLNWIALIWWLFGTLLACLLGFAYVLARYVYDSENSSDEKRKIKITAAKQEYLVSNKDKTEIKIDIGTDIWHVMRGKVEGVHTPDRRKPSFPQLGKLFFRRFPFKLIMREFNQSQEVKSFRLKFAGASRQIIKTTLIEGEKAIVNFDNIVGFTDSVKLSLAVDFKFAFFLSRSPVMTCITGPGSVLFATDWQTKEGKEASSIPYIMSPENEKILFINALGRYKLELDHSLLNVYTDDHGVCTNDPNDFITEIPADQLKRQLMNARSILRKFLFLPLPALTAFLLVPIIIMLIKYAH